MPNWAFCGCWTIVVVLTARNAFIVYWKNRNRSIAYLFLFLLWPHRQAHDLSSRIPVFLFCSRYRDINIKTRTVGGRWSVLASVEKK